MLVANLVSADAFPFFAFSHLTCHLSDAGNRCFLVVLCYWIVRRLNLEVATKRLLYQQVKTGVEIAAGQRTWILTFVHPEFSVIIEMTFFSLQQLEKRLLEMP